jgi:hypothetical protein
LMYWIVKAFFGVEDVLNLVCKSEKLRLMW